MFALARRINGQPVSAIAASGISHLGRALKAQGLFETDGELHIHGAVWGRVHAVRLILEPGGYAEADIVAKDVRVAGHFVGRIFAPNVTVDETAIVEGRIFHTTVAVAHGARINGRMPWRPPSYFETLTHLPETQP